jgi:hypothetical protein
MIVIRRRQHITKVTSANQRLYSIRLSFSRLLRQAYISPWIGAALKIDTHSADFV